MTNHDQETTVKDCVLRTSNTIGNPSPDNAAHVNQRSVDGHDLQSYTFVQTESAFRHAIV